MTNDGKAGIIGVDDDFDGTIDEGNKDDDDEDGLVMKTGSTSRCFF